MNEVIVLIFIALFSDGPKMHYHFQPSVEVCARKVDFIYSQTPERYAEDGIHAVFATCLRVIPRPVPKPESGV